MYFGTLTDGLGCFPRDTETYLTVPDSRITSAGIQSLIRVGKLVCPLAYSVLYPQQTLIPRLVLKLFRGEPAISRFDWLFTPTHSSLLNFSTLRHSDLHFVLPKLHPGQG